MSNDHPPYPAGEQPAPPPAAQPQRYAQPGYAQPQHGYAQPGYVQQGYAQPPRQGYPQPGYAQPPTMYAVPIARPSSGLAITSLICGIAGLVLSWALIPIVASLVAVITGHMALGQLRRDPAVGGKGMAIAGLILGYFVVAVVAVSLLGLLFVGGLIFPFFFLS